MAKKEKVKDNIYGGGEAKVIGMRKKSHRKMSDVCRKTKNYSGRAVRSTQLSKLRFKPNTA